MRRSHMAHDMGYPPNLQGNPPNSQGYPPNSQGYPPNSQGYPPNSQGYQPTHDMVEQENQQQEEKLSTKVRALKSLTIDIGNEVRDQNKMLMGMDNDFDSSGNLLQTSMNKLKAITRMGGYKQIWYLLIFCLFVFFVCWMIIKYR